MNIITIVFDWEMNKMISNCECKVSSLHRHSNDYVKNLKRETNVEHFDNNVYITKALEAEK